jgi:hypothetical protein
VTKKLTRTPSAKPPEFPKIPEQRESIVEPLIDGLKRKPTTHLPAENEVAPPNPCAPQPAELDQDPGGGYNPDGTYPQT